MGSEKAVAVDCWLK